MFVNMYNLMYSATLLKKVEHLKIIGNFMADIYTLVSEANQLY